MTKAEWKREVSYEARNYEGEKGGPMAGFAFWMELSRKRPDLGRGYRNIRGDPWQSVKGILRECGFSRDAT